MAHFIELIAVMFVFAIVLSPLWAPFALIALAIWTDSFDKQGK